jgi:hypothetical protein
LHAEHVLRDPDLLREELHRFLRVRQRKQIVEEFTAGVTPAGVFRDECRFEPGYRAFHAREMFMVDAVDGTEPEPDAMQTEWVVSTGAFECANPGAAFVEIVLGVRFDPADRGTFVEQRLMMNRPKADPGSRRDRVQVHTS